MERKKVNKGIVRKYARVFGVFGKASFLHGGGGYSGTFAYVYDDSCDLETHPLRNI